MANREDGTDGRGKPSLGNNRVSGKVADSFGKGTSRGMPSGGTISGKVDSSHGTKAARNSGGNVNGGDSNTDRSQISKTGGRF